MRILGVIAGVIAAGFLVIMIIGSMIGKPDFPGGLSRQEARDGCEGMIRAKSINPATVKFGSANEKKDVEYISFRWGPAELQMQNGFGAMIGKSAVCKVNVKTRALVYLDIE